MKLAVLFRGIVKRIGIIPGGDEGVPATVAAIQAVVDHATHDPQTVRALRSLLVTVRSDRYNYNFRPPLSWSVENEAKQFGRALWLWLTGHVEFERDPAGVELVRHPLDMLTEVLRSGTARGDCDDMTALVCAVLHVAGYRPVVVTVGKEVNGRYQHVFAGVRTGTKLARASVFPLDAQEKVPPGQWPAVAQRVKLWGLTVTEPKP